MTRSKWSPTEDGEHTQPSTTEACSDAVKPLSEPGKGEGKGVFSVQVPLTSVGSQGVVFGFDSFAPFPGT